MPLSHGPTRSRPGGCFDQGNPEFSERVSNILRAELVAIEARRRHFRIEQLLGFLPDAVLPGVDTPPGATAHEPGVAPSDQVPKVSDLQHLRNHAEAAREGLINAQQKAKKIDGSAPSTAYQIRAAVGAQASVYFAAAKAWHSQALRYRDALYLETDDANKETLPRRREAAEAIHQAAVRTLAEAASEARRELGVLEDTAEATLSLTACYSHVLECERKVLEAAERVDAAGESAWHNTLYGLAVAEKELFVVASRTLTDPGRRADCKEAGYVAEEEVQRRSRDRNRGNSDSPAPTTAGNGGADPPDPRLPRARGLALDCDTVGLALSGGGIRSATFCLGILQGLAQLRLLNAIDYLSTVSGGGYIGSWLAAWVHREGSLINVEKQLSPNRVSQSDARRYTSEDSLPLGSQPRNEEPEPVHHLRAYSRYLSPRYGVLSPDTWTLFAIILRNLFVNSLFFLPLAVAAVFGWRMCLLGYTLNFDSSGGIFSLSFNLTLLFGVAFLIAVGCTAAQEERLYESDIAEVLRDGPAGNPHFTHRFILFPLFLFALVGSWIFSLDPNNHLLLRYYGEMEYESWWKSLWRGMPGTLQFAIGFVALALLPSVLVRLYRWRRRRRRLGNTKKTDPGSGFCWRGLFANLLLTLFVGAFLGLALTLLWYLSRQSQALTKPMVLCLVQTVGVPLLFGAIVAGGFAEMAVLGRLLTEYEREWRSRISAYLMLGAAAWLLLAVAVFWIPWAVEQILGEKPWDAAGAAFKAGITLAWAAISGGGAWVASRSQSTGTPRRGAWFSRLLIAIAPPIFLLGLLSGVSALGQQVSTALNESDWFGMWGSGKVVVGKGESLFLTQAVGQPGADLFLTFGALLIAFGFGYLINVNRFSLHMLYANRLTRCYLGASCRKQRKGSGGSPTGVRQPQPLRQPNLFTGFDPWDDLTLSALRTVGPPSTVPYAGPLPLINCALNVLAGDELAYQDRRADAFVMTPTWCGGRLTGYVRTPVASAAARNLTLGRVMTISGAAVDPNMNGLDPPMTALMTLLNTRLGWWLENPNPGRQPQLKRAATPWAATEPGLGLRLLWEFFGWTNEKSKFIHVSDGGHFENLGVYELIRRRCRFIIVADAGTDRVAASDNMAAMLRLIRTDFGVNIELDPSRMQLDGAKDHSAWHCCVGRIRYDEVDESAMAGVLVYLQATLTGDEPPDLLQYASRHPAFPRQSTLNQFFDEAQFEAYRALGHHIASEVFGEAATKWEGPVTGVSRHREKVQSVFFHLRAQWFPPLDCSTAEWIAAAQLTLQHEQHLDGQSSLNDFANKGYPEVKDGIPVAEQTRYDLAEFRAVSQTLQVMEAAWSAMKLNGFYAHPVNRGWMNTFRRWTDSQAFHRYWPFLRAEYSRPFVSFCEDILNLQIRSALPVQFGNWQLPSTLANFDASFAFEWTDAFDLLELPAVAFPRAGYLADMVSQAVSSPLVWPFNRPFAWILRADDTLQCGLAVVARTGRQRLIEPVHPHHDPQENAEFLLWMRGPYRSIGIGRQSAKAILRQIEQESAFPSPQPNQPPLRRLSAYFPLRQGGSGVRLECERWMDFYFDLGFRRQREPEHGIGSHFVILKHELT